METRASIVRGCLFTYAIGMSLLFFASVWTYPGRIWTAWVDLALALITFAMALHVPRLSRPHPMVSGTILMSAAMVVIAALQYTIYGLPFFGSCHLIAAACYTALTFAIARGLPADPSFSLPRAIDPVMHGVKPEDIEPSLEEKWSA